MEKDSRREAREEHELLFQELVEHQEQVAAVWEREKMLRKQDVEESRKQMLAFQQGLLAMFGILLEPQSQSQPEPHPLDLKGLALYKFLYIVIYILFFCTAYGY